MSRNRGTKFDVAVATVVFWFIKTWPVVLIVSGIVIAWAIWS